MDIAKESTSNKPTTSEEQNHEMEQSVGEMNTSVCGDVGVESNGDEKSSVDNENKSKISEELSFPVKQSIGGINCGDVGVERSDNKKGSADNENTSNKPTISEEHGHRMDHSVQEINTSVYGDVGVEGNDNEKASVKQKETIEILKVELVASGKEDYVEAANDEVVDYSENDIETAAANALDSEKNETETIDTNGKLEVKNPTATKPINTGTSSLGLLAQYDSDNDSVIEVPIASAKDYRNQVVEIDSDSDSDDSSDSSEVEYLSELRKTIDKRIEVADEDDEEDDNEDSTNKKKSQTKLRVKGEMQLDDLPPIQDLQITVSENECIEFGKIHSIVDQLVLVSALPNSILLNLETVIFLEKGQKVLGEVFDVLGQVADPLYCVRFNSNKQIKEKEINIGDVVYVAPKTQYTQYVILSNLIKTKGSDASWENDVEPPPRFLDYSDDEQEQLARRQMRNKDRSNDNEDPTKKPRTVDDEIDFASNGHQNRNKFQRNSRGGQPGYSNANTRPHYNSSPQNQQRTLNHHRSSWHSNYYPQSFPSHLGMHPTNNQPHSSQAYPPHVPPYAMPPVNNMPYSLAQQTQHGRPPMFRQYPQPTPDTFSFRPPSLYGPPHVSQHQYSSTPPPPPGSQ